MKKFISLFVFIITLSLISSSFACSLYKKSEGYKYLEKKEAEAVEYKNALPVEEPVDISDDVVQINELRVELRQKYAELYELKVKSKRYLKRKLDKFDEFENITKRQENPDNEDAVENVDTEENNSDSIETTQM